MPVGVHQVESIAVLMLLFGGCPIPIGAREPGV